MALDLETFGIELILYPNRSHSISEGQGDVSALSKLYTAYLKEKCPPGAR
jgi:dipeptidyl-peptidase-4